MSGARELMAHTGWIAWIHGPPQRLWMQAPLGALPGERYGERQSEECFRSAGGTLAAFVMSKGCERIPRLAAQEAAPSPQLAEPGCSSFQSRYAAS